MRGIILCIAVRIVLEQVRYVFGLSRASRDMERLGVMWLWFSGDWDRFLAGLSGLGWCIVEGAATFSRVFDGCRGLRGCGGRVS